MSADTVCNWSCLEHTRAHVGVILARSKQQGIALHGGKRLYCGEYVLRGTNRCGGHGGSDCVVCLDVSGRFESDSCAVRRRCRGSRPRAAAAVSSIIRLHFVLTKSKS
jgi:hypothetical protein